MDEVKKTWRSDIAIQTFLQDILINPTSHHRYSKANNVFSQKGKFMVGNDSSLQNKIIALYNDFALEDNSGATVTAKRTGNLFFWTKQQKHIGQYVGAATILTHSLGTLHIYMYIKWKGSYPNGGRSI